MNRPMRVAVTGAAGQIGYSLLFRIASGEMLGKDQPVILQLLEIPDEKAQKALKGVMMELDDCAFPLLDSMIATADPKVAFKDADIALLVGARPRGPGMERKDLRGDGKLSYLRANRFRKWLAATSKWCRRQCPPTLMPDRAEERPQRNPRTSRYDAPDPTRVDADRAEVGKPVDRAQDDVWGNHSATRTRTLHAEVDGKKVWPMINDQGWLEKDFIPTIQKRGAAIIEARGLSSAASAANAAMDHVRNWVYGTPDGDWVSMGLPADGSYGIAEGVIYGYPATCRDGKYQIVQGLKSRLSRSRMRTLKELE